MSDGLAADIPESVTLQGDVGAPKRLRGIALFSVVLDELVSQLGDEISTAELMQAAQSLIEFAKRDYVRKSDGPETSRPGLYAMDVFTALNSYQWKIATTDTPRLRHCDFEEYS